MTVSRRTFLRTGGSAATLAAFATAIPAARADNSPTSAAQPDKLTLARSSERIKITGKNGIVIELTLQGNRLLGISNVSLHGKLLRNPSEYIWPEIATPYGVEVAYLQFINTTYEDGVVVISTRPYYRVIHRMEWTEHAMHPLVNTASWSQQPTSPEGSRVDWIFREVNERYDNVPYAGFSYSFRYRGPEHPIYQIEDKATWELGGNVVGNGFIMRGAGAPHIRFADTTTMYSGWDFPGIANPHVFQHKPLYTQMQGFTFQYDTEQVLLTVHDHPSHVRSLFQRQSDRPAMLHFNQFCFDLTTEHTTPARKILVASRINSDQTTLFNHYLRVRDHLQDEHRKYYGLRYDKTRPVAHTETPDLADVDAFKPVFEQLKSWGIHRTFIMPLWRSTDTDINPRFTKDRQRFGIFGNQCCPLELEIADCYGGWDGFQKIMQQAKTLGIETYIWHASHFSSMTPLQATIPDLFCRDVNGQFNRNNYGHVLMAVNQRSPRYQEYLLNTYRKASQRGLNGLFHDSHFNLATDTINFLHIDYFKENGGRDDGAFHFPSGVQGHDQILSMHDASLRLQSQLQNEIGLIYYVESEGALGTPMTGPDYKYIRGNEFIYSNMDAGLDIKDCDSFGDDATMAYFRGLSARLMFQVNIDPNKFPHAGSVSPWWNQERMAPLNRAFALVEDHMDEMWLLEDDRGMLWKGPGTEVIFAYKDFVHQFKGTADVVDAIRNEHFEAAGRLPAKSMNIYLLRTA